MTSWASHHPLQRSDEKIEAQSSGHTFHGLDCSSAAPLEPLLLTDEVRGVAAVNKQCARVVNHCHECMSPVESSLVDVQHFLWKRPGCDLRVDLGFFARKITLCTTGVLGWTGDRDSCLVSVPRPLKQLLHRA